MNHMGNGAFPDHSVIQAHIRVDLLAVPQNGNIQHHPFLDGKIPVFKPAHGLKGIDFQLSQKSKAAHVDAQHGNTVQRRQLGQMEDRTVPAQRDDQAGVLQLRQQRLDGQIPKSARFGGAEGGTDCRLKPQLLQKLDRCLCGPHAMVTIRVRAEDNRSGIHYTAPSPCSFKVWWDSSTSASRSNVSIWAAPFCRKPRYSILPSGPRIGE